MSLGVLFLAIHNGLSFFTRIAALCWLPLRHNPQTAMAWLLVILLWPLPGGLLYLFLGSTRLPRERKSRHEKAVATLRKAHQRVWKKDPGGALESMPESLARFARLGRKLGEWPIVPGNAMTYFDSAPALFESLARDIDKSRHHVDLLFYIFVVDPSTDPLVRALKRAASRGVECRLLVDALGSKPFLKREAQDLRKAGVQVVEALPLGRLFRRNRLTARYDLRNHRKLALMDAEVGYMGSHNVTDPTYGGKAGGMAWHDLTIRFEGPVVSQLEGVFLEDWFVETGEIPPQDRVPLIPSRRGDFVLQTVPSGPAYTTENFQRLVVSALFEARERVVITTPYLVPDDGLLQALEVAVLNGAKVDLIVPERVDQFLVGNAARAYFGKLLDLGVALHLYQPGILHSKTMTVDGCLAFFGSSNFDIRSFALNFELNMILYGKQESLGLLKIQETYLAASRRLKVEEWRNLPAWEKSLHGMAKLLSPIL
jgi:cardiolipin synthase